jgi:probable DNA metabolism protein
MTYFVYDGSFEGFCTAVFEVYECKPAQPRIRKMTGEMPVLFAEQMSVLTDEKKAARVILRLEALAGKDSTELLWKCYLSGIPGIEDAMLGAIRYALREQRDIFNDFGDPHVLILRQTEKKMRRERHRMTAFVRFMLGKDNLYYALIEPDFDVLPLLTSHFSGRYADQRWLIYDTRRTYGIYYDLETVQFVYPGTETTQHSITSLVLEESEELYQQLWSDYFKSTTIKARKNMKLHLQHVPRRYWKYLPEKIRS